MRDFRKLIVWQRGHTLEIRTHHAFSRTGAPRIDAPRRDQILRAVSSIPTNVSEGCGTRTELEFARYLDIAVASSVELENHFLFVRDMGWAAEAEHLAIDAELVEVRRMLVVLARTVRRRAEEAAREGRRPRGTGERPETGGTRHEE